MKDLERDLKNFYDSYAKDKNGAIAGKITHQNALHNDGTMVTIVCITYNHEEFIAQALDSFLMQKTNFKFKVFVGEDCGQDKTADIIRKYAVQYPEIIIPFIRESNIGAQRNLIDLCQRATSPYIAFCEGDDYWNDEYKLQKQFDFMENHLNTKVCTTKTEIHAPHDWQFKDWYKKINGKFLIPDSIPGYKKHGNFIEPSYIININVAHTSTHFYRWNYDLIIPDWYYEGIIGDTPLLLLQLGNGKLGYIDDITSVYRINSGSIFFDKDKEKNFLRTRIDYIRWMSGFRNYAHENFNKYPIINLENRIKLEVTNYLRVLVKNKETKMINELFAEFPTAGLLALEAYVSFFTDVRTMTSTWTWNGYKLVARNKYYRNSLKPCITSVLWIQKVRNRISSNPWFKKFKDINNSYKRKINKLKISAKFKCKNLLSFLCYWCFSLVPKNKKVWCFSGFNKKSYMDNTKYLYEWIVENHPEIEAYWLTLDNSIYNQLKCEGKPVLKMRTFGCIRVLSRASVVFTDHFVMSDYDNFSGFNNRIKVVQLWHGVGLKSIGDLKNTDVNGVMFSDDILPSELDSSLTRLKKKFKYFRHAYFRELFEEYFMLVCPGKERVFKIANEWNIPEDNCFYSGHPRNIELHAQIPTRFKVLYAPTYRWDVKREQYLIDDLIENAENINLLMKEQDGLFVIRLHPHTWRNYNKKLQDLVDKFEYLIIDDEKDVYSNLGTYSLIVSDYSSIAYDFVLLDRPIVFHCPDLDVFINNECKLNYDYYEYSPGPKSFSWEQTLAYIKEYIDDPQKDSAWRCKVRDEFYNMKVNDSNNSRRIVDEIKRRIHL